MSVAKGGGSERRKTVLSRKFTWPKAILEHHAANAHLSFAFDFIPRLCVTGMKKRDRKSTRGSYQITSLMTAESY